MNAPSPSKWSMRFWLVRNLLLWVLLTIGLAELAPILLLYLEGAPGSEIRRFIGEAALLLAASGIYFATWVDALVEHPHGWTRFHWVSFGILLIPLGWIVRNALIREFVHAQISHPHSPLWGDANLWEQGSICSLILIYCTWVKHCTWISLAKLRRRAEVVEGGRW